MKPSKVDTDILRAIEALAEDHGLDPVIICQTWLAQNTSQSYVDPMYKQIFAESLDLMCIVNFKGEFVQVSDVVEQILGYAPHELENKLYTEFLEPDDLERASAELQKLTGGHTTADFETRFLHKKGHHVYLAWSATTIANQELIVATGRDMTKARQMATSLHEYQTTLAAIFDSAQDGIFVIDPQGNYINVNPYGCELVGYTSTEICQMHINDLRFEEDISSNEARERLKKIVQQGGGFIPELRLRHKNDTSVWVSMKITVMEVNGQQLLLGITRNITHQRETEQALRESEARYRTLFEEATDAILIIDMNSLEVIDANQQTYLHLGYAREEIIQQPLTNLIINIRHMTTHFERVVAQGFETTEVILQMKNGKLRSALMSTRTVLLDGINRFLIMWRDISEMKQIEDALYFASQQGWQHENFLESLVTYLTETLDIDYALVGEFADEQKEHVQTVAIAYRGELIEQLTYPLLNSPCENVIGEVLRAYPQKVQDLFPKDTYLQDWSIEGYVGMPLWRSNSEELGIIVLMNKTPIFNIEMATSVIRVVGVRAAHELEQRQGKLALEHSEARYTSVIRSMTEGIVIHASDGTITDANAQAQRILGLKYEQLIGLDSIDLRWRTIHEDGTPFPGETHPAMITLQTGKPQHNVIMGVHKPDGSLNWISINAEPLILDNEQQHGVVASFNNITELREAQAQQQTAELMRIEFEKQEELNRLRSRVIALISHEFRTPMTVIMTSTSLLRMKADILTKEELIKRLQKIDKQVAILNQMVDEVTAVNKNSYGGYQIQLAQVDVRDFFDNILSEIDIVFETHAPIILNLGKDNLMQVLDETLLHQIAWNLISNAVKYTPLTGEINVNCYIEDKNFVLCVQDTGISIPIENQTYLYDNFYRGDNVGTISGTGLGLSIVQQAVQTLDGTIDFSSETNVGTEFVVKFPLPYRNEV